MLKPGLRNCIEEEEVLIVKLDNEEACNEKCHSVLRIQEWTGMYTLVVPSLSTKFIKNSHQNLPV